MMDPFTEFYRDYLDGTYDCVDRIVLRAYFPLLQSGGGFRVFWRQLTGGDETLDNTHLMRFSGHFSRRIHAFARKKAIPIVAFETKQRKDQSYEKYIPVDKNFCGLFCIFVNRAPAPVLDVERYGNGGINIKKRTRMPYANHYAFHIMDKQWGHIIIRFCPHPPFSAMIILNGHEYVERQALRRSIPFTKVDNCFTTVPNAPALAGIADTMRASRSVGRLADVCERWIYSTCLCFALDTDEQEQTGLRYSYSVYQMEYSRNLLFTRGRVLDEVFNGVIGRTRTVLDIRSLKTIFGYKNRPYNRDRQGKRPRVEIVVEKPVYDLTVFKIHFGRLTVKMYSKGAHVLRIEAIVHNTAEMRCGRSLEKFPVIADRLAAIVDEFLGKLSCVDVSFVDAQTVQTWHKPGMVDEHRTAGIDINDTRQRAVMEALIALSIDPRGISTPALAQKTREILGVDQQHYSTRHAAYDLRKLRGKQVVVKMAKRRAYRVTDEGLRSMAAYLVLRDKVILPILAGTCPKQRNNFTATGAELHIANIQNEMKHIFKEYRIAA